MGSQWTLPRGRPPGQNRDPAPHGRPDGPYAPGAGPEGGGGALAHTSLMPPSCPAPGPHGPGDHLDGEGWGRSPGSPPGGVQGFHGVRVSGAGWLPLGRLPGPGAPLPLQGRPPWPSCPRARPGGWVSCVFSPRVPSRWATPQGPEASPPRYGSRVAPGGWEVARGEGVQVGPPGQPPGQAPPGAAPQGIPPRGARYRAGTGGLARDTAQGEVDAGGPRPDHASYLPPLPGPQAPRGC